MLPETVVVGLLPAAYHSKSGLSLMQTSSTHILQKFLVLLPHFKQKLSVISLLIESCRIILTFNQSTMHSRTPRIDVGQQSPGMQVFEDLKEHCNAPRLSSELVLMEALQAAHPDHIVVRTAKHFCDLIDYAKQGHATAELRTDDGDFDLSRRYIPTGKRIKNKPGKLADSVQWGSYAYNWDGKDFIVYKHEYMDSRRGVVVNLYICHKASDEVIKSGRSDEIDALMHAAGKWTHEIHEEIYVYDGYWSKSKELWKSVNGSSWEEVILDPAMKESLIGDVQGFFDNRDIYKELAVP